MQIISRKEGKRQIYLKYTRCIPDVFIRYTSNIYKKKVIKKIKKMENTNNRNITLSIKVTAEQKAEFTKIATKHNISLSEWSASILEINKDSYDKIGDPTLRETALEDKNRKQEQKIKKLEAQLESGDYRVQVEMERADNAITKRDFEILKFKKLEVENTNLKVKLEDAISKNDIVEKKTIFLYNENKSLILPSIGLASLLFGLLIGKK